MNIDWSELLSLKFMDRYLKLRLVKAGIWLSVGLVLLVVFNQVGQRYLDQMEFSLLDLRLKQRAGNLKPSKDIVMIAVDRRAEKYIRNHPELGIASTTLPRARWAQILDYVIGQGAKAIVFDLELKDSTKDDDALEKVLRKNKNIYSATRMDTPLAIRMEGKPFKDFKKEKSKCLNDEYVDAYQTNPEFLKELAKKGVPVHFEKPMALGPELDSTRCYTGPIVNKVMRNLRGIGITAIRYEPDGFLRKVPVLYQGYQGKYYLYLGMQTAFDQLGVSRLMYTPEFFIADGRKIHIVDGNQIFINWRNPSLLAEDLVKEAKFSMTAAEIKKFDSEPHDISMLGGTNWYRSISAIDVIRKLENHRLKEDGLGTLYKIAYAPETGEFSFKDKIVVLGNTVTDIHRTPVETVSYGPEILMSIMDMFMHDTEFVHKPAPWIAYATIIALALFIVYFTIYFESLFIAFTAGVLLIVCYWCFNFHIFNTMALWFELVMPTLNLSLALAGGTLYRYYIHDKEKHHLTDVFSKYVSPQIMDKILMDPEKAMDNLRGGKKELTVLFSDLQGFTHQFENADPEMMVEQLNEYFDVMTEIILQHGGTYDKYMGDSIMAFFGAPTDVPNHAEMACRAAIEMMKALRYLNDGWKLEKKQPLSHGIGISTGEMFVGNFGSKNIKNFTVMGSNVNLGARLEAYTRVAQWPVIISERTRELTKTMAKVRDLGKVQVKGFREPVQVYGLEKMVELQGNISLWKPSSTELQRRMGTK